jgi:hypothetical protein
LSSKGRRKEAIVHFTEALRLNPGLRQARYNLERNLRGERPKRP